MRISTLPLAISAAAIALSGLITPAASAAELTISNDVCEIAFTDTETVFFQSEFKQARVGLVNSLKAEIPAAAAELDELQELIDNLEVQESHSEFREKFETLGADIAAKGVEAGFKDSDEVRDLVYYLAYLTFFEQLNIHYWDIRYDHDTELLELPVRSAGTVLEFMNMPFEIDEILAEETEMSGKTNAILVEAISPLKSLRAPFTPVFEACANGQPGTIIGDEKDDEPGNDQEPVGRSNSSSFGSS